MENRGAEQISIWPWEVGETEMALSFGRRVRKKQERAGFIDKCPVFPGSPGNQERFLRELSGKRTDSPTKYRQKPREFSLWLQFSKIDKHLVNYEEKAAHIIIHQNKLLDTFFFLHSDLIACLCPFLTLLLYLLWSPIPNSSEYRGSVPSNQALDMLQDHRAQNLSSLHLSLAALQPGRTLKSTEDQCKLANLSLK